MDAEARGHRIHFPLSPLHSLRRAAVAPCRFLPAHGFTLVELLVAIGLMSILIASCVMIFHTSSATVKISEARNQIYNSARAALDHLARDVSSMLPMEGGSQRFWMQDYAVPESGSGTVAMSDSQRHYHLAADAMGFRGVTSVKGVNVTAEIVYRLVKDPDPFRGKTVEKLVDGQLKDGRQLYVLRKEYKNLDGTPLKDPTIAGAGAPTIYPADLCYYVVSFNLEYLASLGTSDPTNRLIGQYSQIAPGASGMTNGPFPGPGESALGDLDPTKVLNAGAIDPMGEDSGSADLNDQLLPSGRLGPKYFIPAIRATLRIVEDRTARQERVFVREIWLPTG